MKRTGKANKVHKKTEKKWDTGDLNERDAKIFKYLPNPEEITELLHPTEDFLKAEAKRTKRSGKRG